MGVEKSCRSRAQTCTCPLGAGTWVGHVDQKEMIRVTMGWAPDPKAAEALLLTTSLPQGSLGLTVAVVRTSDIIISLLRARHG